MVTLNKISDLLALKGKSQRDLSLYLGLTQNAFSNWKARGSRSYTHYLPQIAEFLGVTVEYLTSEDDSAPHKLFTNGEKPPFRLALFGNAEELTEIEKALLNIFRSMDIIKQAQLLAYAVEFAEKK